MDELLQLGITPAITERVGNLLLIGVAFLLAWVVHHFSDRLAKRIMRLGGFAPKRRQLRSERLQTMQGLISSRRTFRDPQR